MAFEVKYSFHLPYPFREALKLKCAQARLPVKQVLRRAVQAYISSDVLNPAFIIKDYEEYKHDYKQIKD